MSDVSTKPSAIEKAPSIEELDKKYDLLFPEKIIEHALTTPYFKRPVIVSSFGAESAVLLHMVAQIKPDMPVIFIDTGKLFGETLRYRDKLQHRLGLESIRIVAPRRSEVLDIDPDGTLNKNNPDLCCKVRKVDVLDRALEGYDSWISGRKRFQSQGRAWMPIVEEGGGRVKLNPMANFSSEAIREYMVENDLPDHPLYKQGYKSIGCFPCTSKSTGDSRSGRWEGSSKTECGIHFTSKGVVRG